MLGQCLRSRRTDSGALYAILTMVLLILVSSPFLQVGVVVGLPAAILLIVTRHRQARHPWLLYAVVGAAMTAIGPTWYAGTWYQLAAVMLTLAGGALIVLADTRPRTALRLAVGASILFLVLSVVLDPGGMLDVAIMHRSASDAVLAGQSPWMGLTVVSGAPGSGGEIITGDPYPPVALVSYLAFDWLLGDPRAAGAAAWLIIAVVISLIPHRDSRPLILLVTSGTLPLLLWTGWTEFVTLALVLGAAALWERRRNLAAVVLGLALASKQYMVMAAAPLLVFRRSLGRWATVIALGVAAAGAASGFLLGEGYLDAIIGVYGEFDVRTDSASLAGFAGLFGIELSVPFFLGPVLGLAVSWWLARSTSPSLAGALRVTACALAVMFAFGTQAFTNYWFLVLAFVLVEESVSFPDPQPTTAIALTDTAVPVRRPDGEGSA